jgi:predicted Zn-dependent peptidase
LTQITRLPSGLTIVTEHRREVETVSLGVFVSAGTRDETPAEHGLAHFLEHMAFKGTKRRSAFQTVADVEALGGDINAETSPEATSYTVRMLAEDWRIGLDVLLDIVTSPRFEVQDIALEQDVVCQEIAGSLDVPDDRLVDGIGLAAFGSHSVGQPILGTEASVRALDKAALNGFRQRTYAPQATIISAAGAIDHDHLVRALEDMEPQFPAAEPTQRNMPDFAPGVFLEARTTHDTHLALAWKAPKFAGEGSMAHALAMQCLGGGMTSRLFQSIREEAGLAYAIDTYGMIFSDCGLGIVQTATSGHMVKPMVERLKVEMARFADGVSEDELNSAKRQFRTSLAMAGESMAGLAARNARHLAVLGHVRPREAIETEIDAASTYDVQQCWASIMDQGAFAKAAVGDAAALDLWAV